MYESNRLQMVVSVNNLRANTFPQSIHTAPCAILYISCFNGYLLVLFHPAHLVEVLFVVRLIHITDNYARMG